MVLATLTSPQPHSLPVLLQLRDQRISLLDNVRILLVLVIWAVGFDDVVDAVDCAGNAVCGYEFGEITISMSAVVFPKRDGREEQGWGKLKWCTNRSKKSTEIPKSLAILPSPTMR